MQMSLLDKKNPLNSKMISADIVDAFTLDELKALHDKLVGGKGPTRKLDVADSIANSMRPTTLKGAFENLDKFEKLAVSEALHSSDGYVPDKFVAQHGVKPTLGSRSGYRSSPSLLRFFLTYVIGGSYRVRSCLKDCLMAFVDKPPKPEIKVVEEIPQYFEFKVKRYEWQKDDPGRIIYMRKSVYHAPMKAPKEYIDVEKIKIEQTLRADAAQTEMWSMLKAISDGKISVSDKTKQPSGDMLWKISRILGGDYYQTGDDDNHKTIGFIRSFAWTMLLQAGGLAKLQGKKLVITSAAKNARSTKPHELIALLWKSWLNQSSFDEFRRIDSIKGQTGRGKYAMSDPSERRQEIVKTLSACPSNVWIDFDEFSRYMRSIGNFFYVTYNPGSLYIGDTNYGAMEYDDSRKWEILQDRYMLCFLLEYASTLGLIDVAFIEPEYGHNNYSSLWGVDELAFLSRYDGLLYFRINALGAFCLGQTEKYTVATDSAQKPGLSVRPNLRIQLSSGKLDVADTLLLETFADSVEDGVWELSKEKSLSACESGHRIEDLRRLLESLDEQELPDQVHTFLDRVETNSKAVEAAGTAILFYCRDSSVASELAAHSLTKNLCQISGKHHLVVKSAHEDKFRKAMRIIGYGLA